MSSLSSVTTAQDGPPRASREALSVVCTANKNWFLISSPSSSAKQQGGHSAWIKDVHKSHAIISGLVFHRSEGNGRLLGSKSPGFWRPVVVDMVNNFQLMRLAGSHKVTYHWHPNDMVSVCKRAGLRLDASGL